VPRKILIIDDNPADSKMLRAALARRDSAIETEVLEDGEQAVEYFSMKMRPESAPDLILLDLNLPLLSGFEVLEFIKSEPGLKKLPVVVLSGSSNPYEIERCYAAGANSYISKPVGLQQVFDMAEHLISYWFEHASLPKPLTASAS
jgi:chemotaxis family two-component system response regulator Rcp1